MSFTRYLLASLRLAFVPKIGVAYRYASEGPFEIGPRFVPKQIKQGYVLYELLQASGHVSEMVTTCGVFASMYREAV